MLPIELALVSTLPQVGFADLSMVSAAIQKQVVRDFGPVWNVTATIDAFATLDDVPVGYWPIIVVEAVTHGGQHRDRNGQPFALIEGGPSWSLAAGHEALEMLADPFGSRLIAGASPVEAQGRVEFLVEVCDPCEDDDFAYTVNGVLVSDFYTPSYFDPVAAAGVRYSFTGAITAPREVLPGGYLTWHEPVGGDWFQLRRFTDKPEIKNLGPLPIGSEAIRTKIDRLTPETYRLSRLHESRPSMRRAHAARRSIEAATAARARGWKEIINSQRRKRPGRER
ncbi:MAG TPA: hypothetical protein VGA73_11955 [Candidatus Binatia bacterium]